MHYITIGNGDTVSVTNDASAIDWKIADKRAMRNSLLAESDSKVVPDRFSEIKVNQWKTYRQALRDMDFADPDNINWPTKPE